MTGAGDLRTIVTFQSRTEGSDGYGGQVTTWGGDRKVHCQFVSGSGREQVKEGRIEASVGASLRARARAVAGIDESWRATINGVTWNIRAVMAFGQRGEWTDFVLERAGKDAAA
jgi:SPP1 family predicted phage head-tail adaptor